MRHYSSIAFAIALHFFALAAQAETTNDPVGHFVSQETLYQKDTLYQIRADINDDGYEDLLISSSNVDRQYPKGRLIWDYYLSDAGKNYLVADSGDSIGLVLPKWSINLARVEEIGNQIAILSIGYAGGAGGSLSAYYFDGNELKLEKLGDLRFKQVGDTPKDMELLDRFAARSSEVRTKASTMEQILSKEAFGALLPEKEPDFHDLHDFAHDANDGSNNIVIHKATGLVVGHYKYGVFTPLDYPYGSDEQKTAGASAKLARSLYPKNIRHFLERREGCDHLRGEEAYNAERGRYLYEQMLKYCKGTDEELRLLKEKYRSAAGISGLLDKFDERVEPEEWIAPD